MLGTCLDTLGKLHDGLDDGEQRSPAAWHTLMVVEIQELLRGQKRGIAVALLKAKAELRKLERRAASGRIQREAGRMSQGGPVLRKPDQGHRHCPAVTALRLGGGGLLAFGESGDSLRL